MFAAAAHNQADQNPTGVGKLPVVALIRVSTADQARDDRGGVPRQRRVIETTIRTKNLDCLNIYEISDVSGTEVLRNPTVIEILELVRSGVIRGLVVADLDRLFRPTEPTDYAILQVFKDTDATIYSGDVEYRLGTKDGQLLSGIRSAISAFEIQLMKERQNGAKEEKRRKGHCPTNRLTMPFGTVFNRKTQQWEWTEKAAIVAEVFRLVDEEGERNYTKLGERFGVTGQTIRNWLRNPIYTGWRLWSQKRGEKKVSRTGKTYRVKVNRKPEEVIRTKVLEPLVSEERFNRVQEITKQVVFNHFERLNRNQAINYGAGILRCGCCGESFKVVSGKRVSKSRNGYYGCKANYYLYKEKLGGCRQRNIPAPYVDELIESFASQTLTDAPTLTAIIETSLKRTADVVCQFPSPSPVEDAQALKRREKRLLDAYEAGEIELDELRRRREEIRKTVVAAERAASTANRRQELDLEEFVRLVVRGAHRLKRMINRKEKKVIIHSLFETLVIKDDAIVAFKLRAELGTSSAGGTPLGSELIHLSAPVRLYPLKEELPSGTKRCIHCQQILAAENFRIGSNRCHSCIAKRARAAYLRRRNTSPEPGCSRP